MEDKLNVKAPIGIEVLEQLYEEQKKLIESLQLAKQGLENIMDVYYANMRATDTRINRTKAIKDVNLNSILTTQDVLTNLIVDNKDYLSSLRSEMIKFWG